ncbi:MAG TPA: transglutaminase domain-containing protein [Haliangium sp.]|nr:transglutaminase domain-containing protein [Haliangium sp.]
MLRLLAGIAVMMLTLHCSHRPATQARTQAPRSLAGVEPSRRPLRGYEAHFHITWNGARIGDASESLRHRGDQLRYERRERITVRRGDALSHSELDLVIDMDARLRSGRVAVRQIASGAVRHGLAERNDRGDWLVTYGDEPVRMIPGEAVPAEQIPLLLAASPGDAVVRFDGPVMLPGYGFAVAHLRVHAEDARHLLATLSSVEGELRSRFVLGQGGTVLRVEGEDGSGAERVDPAAVAAPFAAPEVVDAASIPLAYATAQAALAPALVVLEPIAPGHALPPPLPGQHIAPGHGAWTVRLSQGDALAPAVASGPYRPVAPEPAPDAALERLAARIIAQASATGDQRAEAFALARATAALLADDLGATAASANAALMLGRGDCTAHAVLFAGLARASGIPVRLVTGLRVAGDRLIRHRWAIVAVDGAWIAVDPTHGEAPASARLIGLAVHGTRTAELALADDVAFAGLSRIRAYACPSSEAGDGDGGELSARPCARSRLRTP